MKEIKTSKDAFENICKGLCHYLQNCTWSILQYTIIYSTCFNSISFEVKLPSACSFIVDGLAFCCRCSHYMFQPTWPSSGAYDISLFIPEGICRRQLNLKTYWTIQCSRMLKYNIVLTHRPWPKFMTDYLKEDSSTLLWYQCSVVYLQLLETRVVQRGEDAASASGKCKSCDSGCWQYKQGRLENALPRVNRIEADYCARDSLVEKGIEQVVKSGGAERSADVVNYSLGFLVGWRHERLCFRCRCN
jgi:hypothetical protein